MKYSNRERFLKGISITCSMIAATAAIIAIYQFISGHSSLVPEKTMKITSQIPTSIPIPTPSPTFSMIPDNNTISDTSSSNTIDYTPMTWGCWIGIGLLVGSLAGGIAGYIPWNEIGGTSSGCALGCVSGICVALIVGFLSSTIINHLDMQYAFLWNMAITAIITLCVSSFVGYIIGNEAG